MHQDFDRSVPLVEQRLRVANAKQPGRKHQKRQGSRFKERQRASAMRNAKLMAVYASRFKALVAAYWRGELEIYPAPFNRAHCSPNSEIK